MDSQLQQMEQKIQASLSAKIKDVEKIRSIARKYLVPVEGSEESKDNLRMANGIYAVEVVVSLYNVFEALRVSTPANTATAICDLVVGLNMNPFWAKNTGHLMPLIVAAVNAAIDQSELAKAGEPYWGPLEFMSANLWVEVFPAVAFLVGGFELMRKSSLELKKAFLGLANG